MTVIEFPKQPTSEPLSVDAAMLLPPVDPFVSIPLCAAKAIDQFLRQAIVTADPGTFCLLAASVLHEAVTKAEGRS